jgi:hypothetical protein
MTTSFLVAAKYRGVIDIASIRVFPSTVEGTAAAIVHAKSFKGTGVGTAFIWSVSDESEPKLLSDLMKWAELR